MRLLDIPPHKAASNRAGNEKSTKVLIICIRKRDESKRECEGRNMREGQAGKNKNKKRARKVPQ